MFKGIIRLVDGDKEKFEFKTDQFKSYVNTFNSDDFDFVNLGNIKVAKKQLAYIKFTHIPVKNLQELLN